MTACLDDNIHRTREWESEREKREGVLKYGMSTIGLCATLTRWNAQVHTIFSLSYTGKYLLGNFCDFSHFKTSF